MKELNLYKEEYDNCYKAGNPLTLYFKESKKENQNLPTTNLNLEKKRIKRLNKDIIHLINLNINFNNENKKNIDKENNNGHEKNPDKEKILTIEENKNGNENTNDEENKLIIEENYKFDNDKNNINSFLLPSIKLNDNSIKDSSLANIQKKEYNNNNNNNKEQNINIFEKKYYNKTLMINYKVNIPELNINKYKYKNKIKNNSIKKDENMLNTIVVNRNSNEKKNNFFQKIKIIKNKEILEKKLNLKNNHYNSIKSFLINSNNNLIDITFFNRNNSNLNKNKINNNSINRLDEKYSTKNLSKLDEYYLNMKMEDTKKQIANRFKANININDKNISYNSSIKRDIFNYNEMVTRIKRISILKNIKQRNKMKKEFQTKTNINLRNDYSINSGKNFEVKDIFEYINKKNSKNILNEKKIKHTFKNKSQITRNNLPKKEISKNLSTNSIFTFKNKAKNECYKNINKKKWNILLKKEHIELYSI